MAVIGGYGKDRQYADSKTHHMPAFEDAHAVQALAVAYDLTGNRLYLDACKLWSDRMIAYQQGMIPRGAYYMNHSRAPGQDRGEWTVADSGSIGMAVLATAVRCQNPQDNGNPGLYTSEMFLSVNSSDSNYNSSAASYRAASNYRRWTVIVDGISK